MKPEVSPDVLKQSIKDNSRVTYTELANSIPTSSKVSHITNNKKKNLKSINLLKDFASINT